MNPLALSTQEVQPVNWMFIGILIFILVIFLIVFVNLCRFLSLYIRAQVSGAQIGLAELMGMRLRKLNAAVIINARIQALHAGLDISISQMESHMLAGGDLQRVINAMIAANKANLELPWKTAAAIDLSGRDVLQDVLKQIPPSKPLHPRSASS
jgi:uncharacterized protein YqfA (UPF0365 family)